MRADEVYAILKGKLVKLTEDIKSMGDWEPIQHKGTVQTADDLPADAKEGWMYNIATDSIYGAAGMNVVKTADGWDPMGPIINMAPYLTKKEAEELYQPKGEYLTVTEANKKYQKAGDYLSGTDKTLSVSGKAADAAVTGEKIDSLKSDLSNKITKFYASNQGETHITNSDNGKIQDMMIYGKSSQDGTPTPENPVEIKSVVNPTVKVTNEDGLKVQSVTLNNIILNAIPVSSGGNVTINGQQYIADYVDVERGKLVKKLKSFTRTDIRTIYTWGVNANADNITGFFF